MPKNRFPVDFYKKNTKKIVKIFSKKFFQKKIIYFLIFFDENQLEINFWAYLCIKTPQKIFRKFFWPLKSGQKGRNFLNFQKFKSKGGGTYVNRIKKRSSPSFSAQNFGIYGNVSRKIFS